MLHTLTPTLSQSERELRAKGLDLDFFLPFYTFGNRGNLSPLFV